MNISDNPNSKFLLYFLCFTIAILLLILKSTLEYRKAKARVMKENSSRIASSKGFINCTIDYIRKSPNIKDLINSGSYPSFDFFYDMAKETLAAQFKNDYDSHIEFIPGTTLENPLTYLYKFPYFPTFNNKLSVFEEAIDSLEIENEFLRIFYTRFEEGIKEAEKIEKDAIEYHKTFGNEPSGDPKLHPKDVEDNSDADSDIIEDMSLEDLIPSGTIEEFEDNNLKEF